MSKTTEILIDAMNTTNARDYIRKGIPSPDKLRLLADGIANANSEAERVGRFYYSAEITARLLREWFENMLSDDPSACGCDTDSCNGGCLVGRTRDQLMFLGVLRPRPEDTE